MCEFCEGKKTLVFRDNIDELRTCMGVTQGTHIVTRVLLRGDRIVNEVSTRYRSKSNAAALAMDFEFGGEDVYYENLGEDGDIVSTTKVRFCPMCGRELVDGSFEIEEARLKIGPLRENINRLKRLLDNMQPAISCKIKTDRKDSGTFKDKDALKAYASKFNKNDFDATTKIEYMAELPYSQAATLDEFDESKLFDELTFTSARDRRYTYRGKRFRISDDMLKEFIKTHEVINRDKAPYLVYNITIDNFTRRRIGLREKIQNLEYVLHQYETILENVK